ncbi:MAG: hypothetical protein U0L43_09845 [Muribaculaceae bacterium]|nr:hypothetical protein [Muribaculaceae bacterium]
MAEASEILCRLQEAEINVSVPECNKDVAEDNLREVCNIYSSEPDYCGGWEFVVDAKLLSDPALIDELIENGCSLSFSSI